MKTLKSQTTLLIRKVKLKICKEKLKNENAPDFTTRKIQLELSRTL